MAAAPWLVGRFGPGDLTRERFDEFAAWLDRLGIDKDRISIRAAIVDRPGSGFELHLAQQVLDADGRPFLNAATNDIATQPLIVPVEDGSWPQRLTGMGRGAPAEPVVSFG